MFMRIWMRTLIRYSALLIADWLCPYFAALLAVLCHGFHPFLCVYGSYLFYLLRLCVSIFASRPPTLSSPWFMISLVKLTLDYISCVLLYYLLATYSVCVCWVHLWDHKRETYLFSCLVCLCGIFSLSHLPRLLDLLPVYEMLFIFDYFLFLVLGMVKSLPNGLYCWLSSSWLLLWCTFLVYNLVPCLTGAVRSIFLVCVILTCVIYINITKWIVKIDGGRRCIESWRPHT